MFSYSSQLAGNTPVLVAAGTGTAVYVVYHSVYQVVYQAVDSTSTTDT